MIFLFVADLSTGSAKIHIKDILCLLSGGEISAQARTIVLEIRLVRALTAIMAGAAISVCGLLMQTFFRNPLAGPYVLGVNSGASLGAAIFVLGLPFMASSSAAGMASDVVSARTGIVLAQLGLAGAAWAGAAAVMLIIAWVSRRTRNMMTVLVLGIMFGSGIDALVQLLQYFSDGESLKSYVIWTMGSLSSVTPGQLPLLFTSTSAGLFLSIAMVKPLNLLLMGEEYAISMGVDLHRTRLYIYMVIVLLAGTVTAMCGPIGFLGLAVPHISRFLTGSSDHRTIIPCTIICGAVIMLLCDMAATSFAIPVNVLTSLLGVPMVIWIVLRDRTTL
ncbi:MAG: iron ABC transporter permease [Clostridium sp.]|nr:iron ABC transporter permease [Bacteroides sp.]MCM1198769.1 iron ABC transporter permease [Clostridium sp.]